MARLESFEVAELDLWFNSNDHLPPHFHAEGDGWEVKVFFRRHGDEMFELVWGKKDPSGKLKKRIKQQVKAHREALEEEWEAKVNVTAPGPER